MNKMIAAVVALGAVAAFGGGKAGTRVMPDALKWEQPYGPQGPAFAFVVGDMKAKGPCSFFLKMPAGSDSGWHTHDSNYEATVIKGSPTAQGQGDAAETVLAVGAYFGESAKVNHRNGCGKDSECIVFIRTEKGFSSNPMTADGKPAPMPKPEEKKAEPKK